MCYYSYESQFSHLAPRKIFYLHFYVLTSSRTEHAVGEPSPVAESDCEVIDGGGEATSRLVCCRAHPLVDATRPELERGALATCVGAREGRLCGEGASAMRWWCGGGPERRAGHDRTWAWPRRGLRRGMARWPCAAAARAARRGRWRGCYGVWHGGGAVRGNTGARARLRAPARGPGDGRVWKRERAEAS